MATDKDYFDFTGLTLPTDRNRRLPLEGNFNAESLAEQMIYEWLPYFECHKCGRFDYCKFVQRLPKYPDIARDIKCGVVASALRLFIKSTFSIFCLLVEPTDRQAYLDAAYHFQTFVFQAETYIGTYMNQDFVPQKSQIAAFYYGRGLANLRDSLNRVAENLRYIPEFASRRAILFVEGWSEKAFLDKLSESGSSSFIDLLIDVYGGSGNRRPKRIQMLLDRYIRQGYSIFLQGDADGSGQGIFQQIIATGAVSGDQTFVFEHDFETSVPLPLLLAALNQLEELVGETVGAFKIKVAGEGSISKRLETAYKLDLNPLKMELANQIADILNNEPAWWQDKSFMGTELGRFLEFISKVF